MALDGQESFFKKLFNWSYFLTLKGICHLYKNCLSTGCVSYANFGQQALTCLHICDYPFLMLTVLLGKVEGTVHNLFQCFNVGFFPIVDMDPDSKNLSTHLI